MSPLAPLVLSSALLAAFAKAQDVTGTFPATPLASKHYQYPDQIPYQVDDDKGLIRGTQFGYNLCNSTTEGQDALCQTSFLNSLDDFCLWAPSKPNSLIADTEGEEVAWCTKPGRGTRLIPDGALTGVQFMRTSAYVQVIGFMDQTKINIADGDYGGELDPHGADLRGNPMGGLVYSTAFSSSGDEYTQMIEWHNFMGGNAFCFKVCDPSNEHAADFCQHIYDRIGCAYNAPNNAQDNVFESCEGDVQDYPGVYTGEDGQVTTYTQPPESLGAITTMPYQPKVPASSNCQTFTSADLYSALASVSADPSNSAASSSATGDSSSAASGSHAASSGTGTATRGAATHAAASGTGAAAEASGSNAAMGFRGGADGAVWSGLLWAGVAAVAGAVGVMA
ncbi:hypothetical protein BD626DRAFT_560468 [Schizophyllum amplum]|uniref:Macrofage activating glycoprotein n=1 Tax=Schizophyllum amplum TaxID=97359 RepID=A0A550BXM0_9AGAR|nr:hypothetical protein BD626DRAFT_560468 [Auriculariopsis ampla]